MGVADSFFSSSFFFYLSLVKSTTRIPYSVLRTFCCYCLCHMCQNRGVIAKPTAGAEQPNRDASETYLTTELAAQHVVHVSKADIWSIPACGYRKAIHRRVGDDTGTKTYYRTSIERAERPTNTGRCIQSCHTQKWSF